ncbi:MAG: FecR family protein [Tannerella sp.]|nr:FecR family protein [Tannerella sp.]
MENKKSIFELLSGYFSDSISQEERAYIEEWIRSSEENRLLALRMYDLSYTSDTLFLMKEMNPDSVLKKIKKKVAGENRMRILKTGLQRIAVVLLIPSLIISCLYFMPDNDPSGGDVEVNSNFGLISSLVLPDGSKVWLNSGSHIKYPLRFKKDCREVYLTGEAYLSVVKDESRKFIVRTLNDLSVEVAGTEFNIDAYETNDKITTTLVEGSICLYYQDCDGRRKKYAMKPEQQTVYSRKTGKLSGKYTYVPKDVAWKNRSVIFRNTPFDEALWILSKRFNVDFIVKKESLHDYSFTGSFTDQHLTRILEHFKISSGINYAQRQVVTDDGEILKSEIDLY